MRNKVLLVEGFHEIPDQIQELVDKGWDVFNASRPLPGIKTWRGDFRHGIFYAAMPPKGDPDNEPFRNREYLLKRCRELDGHLVEIVSRETVEAYRKKLEERYGDLSDFDYANVVHSYLFWRRREEHKNARQ